jgi:dTDP-4-dehydrorhamnose 3,5-epimerase
MLFEELTLKGAYSITLDNNIDERGSFTRNWCKDKMEKQGLESRIVQVNHSINKEKGTVRGLHFQYQPHSEVKIVRCIKGVIWDVIVDLRKISKTYGCWFGARLSAENHKMFYIPQGFAHGFQTLEDNSEILYFHSEYYNKACEGRILYNDEKIAIEWPISVTNVSKKDLSNKKFKQIKSF